MTESGEQLTQKGEFGQSQESVFSFNRGIGISYAMDIDDRSKVEITMTYPNEKQAETFQMIFVLKGEVSFAGQDGAISYGQIGTLQHNLYRIVPGATRMVMNNVNDEVLCINLSSAFLSRYLPGSHPAHQQLNAKQKTDVPMMLFPLNMHITPEISAILQPLGNSSESGFHDQLLLESKAIELFAHQIAQFEQLQNSADTSLLDNEERERMQKVREILINHTGKQLSLRSLAHMVGTNEFNLKRNFKVVFGNTVYGYLNQYKMEQAKHMLIEKGFTVAEIAQKTGYKHGTHFTNAFKKYFGYLPNKIKSIKLCLFILMQDFSMVFESLEVLMA